MKPNYFAIPVLVFLTAWIGGIFTSNGMEWYLTGPMLPARVPQGSVIGTVWTILFTLMAISAIIAYNKHSKKQKTIVIAFITNAIINIGWSATFFTLHLIGPAIAVAALLGLSVLALIIILFPVSRTAAYLLVPYLAWVCFATYLNYQIYILNIPGQ